jgi:hypothetical protein
MSRAWPFQEVTEATGPSRPVDPLEFVARFSPETTDAVVVRIGISGAQLVLVAEDGYWDKWVYPSVEGAQDVALAVGIEAVHVGEYPEDVRVRMNAYRRPKADFDHGAYQEQGRVGPIIPYPENRPREASALERGSAARPGRKGAT